MHPGVTLTVLAVTMCLATLLATVLLALVFYYIQRRKVVKHMTNTDAMVKPNPLPVQSSRTLLQLRQHDYIGRFYNDSDDPCSSPFYHWNSQPGDTYPYHSLDEFSDGYSPGRRSSSIVSTSSPDDDNILWSSPTNSPLLSSQHCQLNISLMYNTKIRLLTIVVINVCNPPYQGSDVRGFFMVVQLYQRKGDGTMEDVDFVLKTDVKPCTSNVLFNHYFQYDDIPLAKLENISVRFSLCSHDKYSRMQTVGDFVVNLGGIEFEGSQNGVVLHCRMQPDTSCLPTEEKEKGELSVSLRYKHGAQRINVIVLKATNLKKPKKLMSNDTYVTVKLLHGEKVVSKKNTRMKKGSVNPCWNEPFVFDLLENLEDYFLLFVVKGRDLISTRIKLGTVCIGSKAISTGETHWNDSVLSKNNTMRQVTMSHKLV